MERPFTAHPTASGRTRRRQTAGVQDDDRTRSVRIGVVGLGDADVPTLRGRRTRERLEAELNALLEKNHGVITLHD